jgi:hypothetical protein
MTVQERNPEFPKENQENGPDNQSSNSLYLEIFIVISLKRPQMTICKNTEFSWI